MEEDKTIVPKSHRRIRKKVKIQEMHIEGLKASCRQFSAKTQQIYCIAVADKYRDDVLNERLNARANQDIVVEGEIKSNLEDNNVGNQITYMSTWGTYLYMFIVYICAISEFTFVIGISTLSLYSTAT